MRGEEGTFPLDQVLPFFLLLPRALITKIHVARLWLLDHSSPASEEPQRHG